MLSIGAVIPFQHRDFRKRDRQDPADLAGGLLELLPAGAEQTGDGGGGNGGNGSAAGLGMVAGGDGAGAGPRNPPGSPGAKGTP